MVRSTRTAKEIYERKSEGKRKESGRRRKLLDRIALAAAGSLYFETRTLLFMSYDIKARSATGNG